MALRGDDLVGVVKENNKLTMLKGESKSRRKLSKKAIDDASVALGRDRGRPGRHSVLFIAERLREIGDDDLAEELERALLDSFQDVRVDHMLFVVGGGDAGKLLSSHLSAIAQESRVRHAVAVNIEDLAEFVDLLFEDL